MANTLITNDFLYQLELNQLNTSQTKADIRTKIIQYNAMSFRFTASCKIQMDIAWYTNPVNNDWAISILNYFKLLKLAVNKYAELYDILDLQIYAQQLYKFKINITKE